MSDILQWVPFLLFVLLFAAAVVAEVMWLARKGWTTSGRATGYAIITDILAFGIGSLIVLTAFFVMFMMVMGPAGTGSNVPGAAYLAVTAIGIIAPFILLVLLKRLFLMIFKIQSGRPAWIYSLVGSVLISLVVLLPPPLVFYLLSYVA